MLEWIQNSIEQLTIEAQLSRVTAVEEAFAAPLPPVKGVAAEVGPAKLCWANGKHPFDCRICGVLAECYGLIAGFCGPWGCQDTPVFHSQCNAHWLFFIR